MSELQSGLNFTFTHRDC